MNKSKRLCTYIYNLVKDRIWSVDFGGYQAISWNTKGVMTEEDFNELIEKLEQLRPVENTDTTIQSEPIDTELGELTTGEMPENTEVVEEEETEETEE